MPWEQARSYPGVGPRLLLGLGTDEKSPGYPRTHVDTGLHSLPNEIGQSSLDLGGDLGNLSLGQEGEEEKQKRATPWLCRSRGGRLTLSPISQGPGSGLQGAAGVLTAEERTPPAAAPSADRDARPRRQEHRTRSVGEKDRTSEGAEMKTPTCVKGHHEPSETDCRPG